MPNFAFQLVTPYGPVAFTATFGEEGGLLSLVSSTSSLSAGMLKLTFGERADSAGAYFQSLADNVAYQLEVLQLPHEVPSEFQEIHAYLQKNGVALLDPLLRAEDDPKVARLTFWSKYPRLRNALFTTSSTLDSALQRMAGSSHKWSREPGPVLASLEPWVITLFGLADVGSVHLVWEILGHLGTRSAADRMLLELERPGFHPDSKAILRGLQCCFDPHYDAERLLAIGHRKEFHEDLARPYLRVLKEVISDDVVTLAKSILSDQVDAAPEALQIFRTNKVSRPLSILKQGFWDTEKFWVTFRYIELFRELATPDQYITLSELNLKLADERFADTAPVTWQQQLSETWKSLINEAPAQERLRLIMEYLSKPAARLQYNALLQLNYLIREFPGSHLDPVVYDRLQDLVTHRYDKVAAQAISAIRKLIDHMPDWPSLNARLMPISTTPGFRVAKLKLLKHLGQQPEVAKAQQDYFIQLLDTDLTPDTRMVTKSIIKYLRLGDA